VFFIVLYQSISDPPPFIYSHYFNLTEPPENPSSTASTSSLPTTPNEATGTNIASTTAAASVAHSASISNGAAIGAGVGGGLGGALLILGAGYLFYKYQSKKKEQHLLPGGKYSTPTMSSAGSGFGTSASFQQQYRPPVEMANN
jgi:hypothetical protein